MTSVTWTRDSKEVEGGWSVISNTRSSIYTSYLNVSVEGVYRYTVRNNKPSTTVYTLNLTGELCIYMV